jgi:HAD superfamily hydrolase (TIGR01509 family)
MIRNIIFDLGNVLISFRPSDHLEKKKYPPELRDRILTDIFSSQEWLLLDNGDICLEEAIDRIAKKSVLKRKEIAFIFKMRTEIMFPLRNNVSILPGLKKQGFRLYYLSNFPLDIFSEIKNGIDFFRYFDGGIISAEVRQSKPSAGIFKIFLEKYNLRPKESLYIDDIEINVKAAESTGMKGYCTSGSTNITDDLENFINSLANKH